MGHKLRDMEAKNTPFDVENRRCVAFNRTVITRNLHNWMKNHPDVLDSFQEVPSRSKSRNGYSGEHKMC
ncbi:hypothetical protein B0H34DRAFT_693320 [Crassisporium funariophilum]|nr:hypothetical protein B0H34DRAFT_693320 [Crassisporium funariophilum]